MSKSTTCPAVTTNRYMSTSVSGVIAELAVSGDVVILSEDRGFGQLVIVIGRRVLSGLDDQLIAADRVQASGRVASTGRRIVIELWRFETPMK